MPLKRQNLAVLFLLMVLLAGCGAGGSPSQAVEDYLGAIVDGDWTQAVNLSCASWEEGARAEANSFESIDAWLEGVACATQYEGTDTAAVSCQGVIRATYGTEERQLTLEGRVYQVVRDGGEWRVCGYQ